MYRLFYLPFSVEFQQGATPDEVLPYVELNNTRRMILADELKTLNAQWDNIRKQWENKSLILKTPVGINKTVSISHRLRSHRVSLSRGPFDTIRLEDRIKIRHELKKYSADIQAAFKQLRFLKSLLKPGDTRKFNLFVIGPHWCRSTREYRMILETYVKKFRYKNLNLHSVVIHDPKEKIFDSQIMRHLLPNEDR